MGSVLACLPVRVQKTFDYEVEGTSCVRAEVERGPSEEGWKKRRVRPGRVERGNISFKGRVCALTLRAGTNSVLGVMDRRHRMCLNRVVVWPYYVPGLKSYFFTKSFILSRRSVVFSI